MRDQLKVAVAILAILVIACSIGMRLPGVGASDRGPSFFQPLQRTMGDITGLGPNTPEQGRALPLHQWLGIILALVSLTLLAGLFFTVVLVIKLSRAPNNAAAQPAVSPR